MPSVQPFKLPVQQAAVDGSIFHGQAAENESVGSTGISISRLQGTAPAYNNTTKTYALNDLVLHEGDVYINIEVVDPAENFDSTKWKNVSRPVPIHWELLKSVNNGNTPFASITAPALGINPTLFDKIQIIFQTTFKRVDADPNLQFTYDSATTTTRSFYLNKHVLHSAGAGITTTNSEIRDATDIVLNTGNHSDDDLVTVFMEVMLTPITNTESVLQIMGTFKAMITLDEPSTGGPGASGVMRSYPEQPWLDATPLDSDNLDSVTFSLSSGTDANGFQDFTSIRIYGLHKSPLG